MLPRRYVRGVGVAEREIDGVAIRILGIAAERVADHIDAIEDGLLNRGDDVAVERAVGADDPVGDHVRAWRDARDGALLGAERRRFHVVVAGRRGGGVRAMTVVVSAPELELSPGGGGIAASCAVMMRYAPISLPLHVNAGPGFVPPENWHGKLPGGAG